MRLQMKKKSVISHDNMNPLWLRQWSRGRLATTFREDISMLTAIHDSDDRLELLHIYELILYIIAH